MPLIQVRVAKNTFTPAQKRQIINKLTDVVVPAEGAGTQTETAVLIEEVGSGERGIDSMYAACASFLGYGCI